MQTPLGQPQPTSPTQRQWFIQVDGQAYGPFDDRTLWQYMTEGRVSAQSLISQAPNTGYRPVSADPSLMNWLAQVPSAQPVTPPEPQANPTVFMIMGEIRSGRGMEFMQTLQGLGPTQRIGTSVWLLQSRTDVQTLRDVLSQPLGADDRLFVLDSFANQTAWFNLSPEMDNQISTLWDIQRD
jgi:hypothetical protein